MTNKLPTIDIKGKKYVLVSERVLAFNDKYTKGCIETELISPIDSKMVVVKATVTPDVEEPTRRFVAYSQATIGQGMVNTTSALENAETSAVGRALGFMGIGVIESIASADEMNKAINSGKAVSQYPTAILSDKLDETSKYKCEICGTNVETAHKPSCPNQPKIFKNADGESFGTKPQ